MKELRNYWTAKNGNRSSTRFIVIHHAAAVYTPGNAIQSIYNYHKNKWPAYNGIAYHIVCQEEKDRSIQCYLVNPPDMQGAGVANRNHEAFHICLATNFRNDMPQQQWIDAARIATQYALQRYPHAQVVGHKDIALPGYGTSCPGNAWPTWKNQIIAQVQKPMSEKIRSNINVPPEKLVAFLLQKGIDNASQIAAAYTTFGAMTKLGNVYPLAQAIVTSNSFSSTLAKQNNPAHVGTGSFVTLEEGILAQYAHLLVYATVPNENTDIVEQLAELTPRYDAVIRAYGRGNNTTWQSLVGKWSLDKEYGKKIVELGNNIV